MAKFLNTTGISYYWEQLTGYANDRLIINSMNRYSFLQQSNSEIDIYITEANNLSKFYAFALQKEVGTQH